MVKRPLRWKGRTYALPTDVAIRVLLYDKGLSTGPVSLIPTPKSQ